MEQEALQEKITKHQTTDWYNPGKSMAEFHQDPASIRVLIGSRGCGKTFGVMVEAVKHCWRSAGAEVRVFRKWASSQRDSVADTLQEVLEYMGPAFEDTGRSLCKKMENGTRVRIPSKVALEMWVKYLADNPRASASEIDNWLETTGSKYCGHIVMDGLPDDDKAEAKIRSSQVSMLIFVEADQIKEAHVIMAEGCLRKRDADGKFFEDYSIILETNPPSPRHWLAKWELGDESWRAGDTARGIPPRKKCKFWHIPIYENVHNMRPNYAEDLEEQYANDPCGFNRFVLGQYDEHYAGTPVFKNFTSAHVRESLGFPQGAYMVRGWDYGGSNNTVVWLSYFVDEKGYERFWALKELWLQHSTVEEQATASLKITEDEFPDINDKLHIAGVYDFGDIAGGQKTATGSVVNVLSTFGIYPGAMKMGLEESLSVISRLLSARDDEGKPLFLVDKVGCPKLYSALRGEYRYPLPGEPGWNASIMQPLKGIACNHADHVCDALRYAAVNMFRLLRVDNAERFHRVKKGLNPKKVPR
jgi:hypothetical protein